MTSQDYDSSNRVVHVVRQFIDSHTSTKELKITNIFSLQVFQCVADLECYLGTDKPYGLSYGSWTVEWWRWAFSMPDNSSPILDVNGKNAGINQPDNDIWFLAGTWASEKIFDIPLRVVCIPHGRSILFPIINCEANYVEYPDLKTEKDLTDKVTQDENSIVLKEAAINNLPLIPHRVESDPAIFTLKIPDPSNGGRFIETRAAADGYWVFLKPLPRDMYDLQFRGSCEMGRLRTTVKYEITIQ